MLRSIKIHFDVNCPECDNDFKHEHSFKLADTMGDYRGAHINAIGHTLPLVDNSIWFNCPHCGVAHCPTIEPIEYYVLADTAQPVKPQEIELYKTRDRPLAKRGFMDTNPEPPTEHIYL